VFSITVACVAGSIALVAWQRVRTAQIDRTLARASAALAQDRGDALASAEDQLAAALSQRPGERRLLAARADVAATRWYRFGGGEAERQVAAASAEDAA